MRRLTFHDVDEIAAILDHGGVVALPTDTVYGVAALLTRPPAVARLFVLKERPVSVALPILVGSFGQLDDLGIRVSDREKLVTQTFWPGALTLVCAAPSELAAKVGSSDATVGVRWPGDSDLERVLQRTGPLAVTSANHHGQPPCHSAADVERAFAWSSELAAVVDGGYRDGTPSTVVRVSAAGFTVFRAGAVTREELTAALGPSREPESAEGDH